jgi:methylenetetrahydrofolate dehydrogenase (NADP+) / methenyltetrahydrofolate cyclohydrolase
VRVRVAAIADQVRPGLATVLVGDDAASAVYVRMKHKACEAAGLLSVGIEMPGTTTQAELLAQVDELNARDDIHGILVQLPLPDGLDENEVIERLKPEKDVDGLHPISQGKLLAGTPGPRPCTPAGVIRLLDEVGVDPKGKRAVVVGRSLLVGKPIALLLLERHATVTMCHSRTADLAREVGEADILVAAIGKPRAIPGEWIKPGATVIDVGVNRTDDGLVGDVDYESAVKRAAHITPVPGGVGPMTIAMLLSNTVDAAIASVS